MMIESDLKTVFPRFYAILPAIGKVDVTLGKDDSPVESAFAGDVVILYGRDLGSHYQLVSRKELHEVNLTTSELHNISVENLSNTEKEIRLHKAENYWFVICDGNLEASLLLHTGIWDYVQDQVGGDIVCAVPARDLLMISGTSKEQITALKKKASESIEFVDKPLSSRLFLRIAGGWKEYQV